MWRGSVGFGIICFRISPYVSHYPHALLRFHIPLIEPDVQISRIRLSDKASCIRPREAFRQTWQMDKSQLLMQVRVRVA